MLATFRPLISVYIEWKQRANGIQPLNSIITNEVAKARCAALLVEFYETRISLQFNSTGARSDSS